MLDSQVRRFHSVSATAFAGSRLRPIPSGAGGIPPVFIRHASAITFHIPARSGAIWSHDRAMPARAASIRLELFIASVAP